MMNDHEIFWKPNQQNAELFKFYMDLLLAPIYSAAIEV
jgi:hypothetical protein